MQKGTGGVGALLVIGLGMGLLRGGTPQSGSASGRTGSTQRQVLAEVNSHPDSGEREKGKLCAAKGLLDTIEAFSPQV